MARSQSSLASAHVPQRPADVELGERNVIQNRRIFGGLEGQLPLDLDGAILVRQGLGRLSQCAQGPAQEPG